MYTAHYKLEKKPFQISSDPEFLWLGDSHKEALAVLQYGILDNKGFLLLTGDVGTGKTTLINALIDSLGDEILAATVPDPGLEPIDFYNYVAYEFGKRERVASKGDFIFWFRRFLNRAHRSGQRVLLIIDEAQRLDREMLEEIRLLSNIELDDIRLLNIFFVGQNEFNELLWDQSNRALRQRITINYSINPLSEKESGEYIRHRLAVAGGETPIFTPNALAEIASYSGGFPRTINIICDHALLTGYVAGKKEIDSSIIRECVDDLRIPNPAKEKTTDSEPEIISDQHEADEAVAPDQEIADAVLATVAASGRWVPLLLVIGIIVIAVGTSLFFFSSYLDGFDDDRAGRGSPAATISGPRHSSGHQAAALIPSAPARAPEQADLPTPATDAEKAGTVGAASPDTATAPSAEPIKTDRASAQTLPLAVDTSTPPNPTANRDKTVIRFKFNSNDIPRQASASLDSVSDILVGDPKLKVKAIGYTDASGDYSYNKWLSLFRADVVRKYLIAKGVRPDQVTAIGMGPEDSRRPGAAGVDAGNHRRVEIVFVN